MSDDKRKRKRGRTVEYVPAPILQTMPGQRVRVDPSVLPDLFAWLAVVGQRYDRQAKLTLSGLRDEERQRRRGQIEYARNMLRVLSDIAATLHETLPVDDVLRARDAARDAMYGATVEG